MNKPFVDRIGQTPQPQAARRVTSTSGPRPVVGLSCCRREINGSIFHTVADQYTATLLALDACDIVLLPAIDEGDNQATRRRTNNLLGRLDGILLTGGRSMVQPHHYGESPIDAAMLHDPGRDTTTLSLVEEAVRQEVPLFGICRGFQEMCCALGGKLHQDLGALGRGTRHAAPEVAPIEAKYRAAHRVDCVPGGTLWALALQRGLPTSFRVNSLHRQGMQSASSMIEVEVIAEDGLVEAIRVRGTATFMYGVQWHPEWFLDENPFNRMLFEEFLAACATHARREKWSGTGPAATVSSATRESNDVSSRNHERS